MQVIENKELFSELSNEEAATASGGTLASGANYATLATALTGAQTPEITLLFTIDALRER
ncbi:MAG: hypothetical protein ACLBM3_20195 [Dolichospermum sp.]|jgi:hypothetical protein|nr:hypothetical protein [Dolichospermum sp. BR01]MBS9390330.1 hypothetical protein [Dolichospermum sp. WA123]